MQESKRRCRRGGTMQENTDAYRVCGAPAVQNRDA
jgi:hypothetical protein